jgi:hypothetical protein
LLIKNQGSLIVFNCPFQDTCLRLDLLDVDGRFDTSADPQWRMLFLNIQNAVEKAFTRRCQFYSAESKKLLKMREPDSQLPSSLSLAVGLPWPFSTYFLVRESFAIMCRQFRLYEDALRAFDDAISLFNECPAHSVDFPIRSPANIADGTQQSSLQTFVCECTEKPCNGPCDFGFCAICVPGPALDIDCTNFRQRFQGLSLPPMNELEFRRYVFANQLNLTIKLRLSPIQSTAASASISSSVAIIRSSSARKSLAAGQHVDDMDSIIQMVRSFFVQISRLMKPEGRYQSKFKRKICTSPECSITWLLSATLDVREVFYNDIINNLLLESTLIKLTDR